MVTTEAVPLGIEANPGTIARLNEPAGIVVAEMLTGWNRLAALHEQIHAVGRVEGPADGASDCVAAHRPVTAADVDALPTLGRDHGVRLGLGGVPKLCLE